MKTSIALLIVLAVLVNSAAFGAAYGGGSGTAQYPYKIYTPEQMNTIGTDSSDCNKCFKLMADVNMAAYTGTQYNIIGDSIDKFTGTFNGNNHKIINLTYITTNAEDYIGLFGYTSNATITNLGVENVLLSSGGIGIGAIVGRNDGTTTLTNCYASGSVSGTGESMSSFAGLVGINYGTLTDCYANVSVSGTGLSCYDIGGLVGYNGSTGVLTNCYANGSVSGTGENSYDIGGLVGFNNYGALTNCYASGSVSGDNTSYNIGGLVGGDDTGSISNCFWDIQTSGTGDGVGNIDPDPAGAVGNNTVDMQTQLTFTDAGWDFSIPADWQMPNNDYPRLIWETIPPAPADVSATDGTYTDKVTITWTAAEGATAYDVYRYTSNDSGSSEVISADVVGTSSDDVSATAGDTYWYWVKAKNAAGASDFSSGNSGYKLLEAPLAPTNVSATDGTHTDKVTITWTASEGATAYDVYRYTSDDSGSSEVISADVVGTSSDDVSATAGDTYWYWVKAKNAAGASDFSSGNSGYKLLEAPLAPTNVSATDGTHTDKVTITWTAAEGATAYDVYRYTSDDSGSSEVISADVVGTSSDDVSATAGDTYWYWVKAKNAAGASDFSSGDSGYKLLEPPSAPTNVAATDGAHNDKVTITWTAAEGATAYDVYRYTSNDSGSSEVISADVVGTSSDDTSAVAGDTYWYWIKAKNAAGASDFSSGDSGYKLLEPPSAPTNVAATDGTHTDKVTITWTAAEGATAYDVYRYTSDDSGSSEVISADVVGTSSDDTSAIACTTYWYWVKAKNGGGESDFSGGNSGYLGLSAPTDVAATDGTYTDKVTITWSASEGATAYDVYRYTSDDAESAEVISSDITDTTLDDESAETGTTYWYWVKAKNDGGASDFSSGDSGYKQMPPVAISGYVRSFNSSVIPDVTITASDVEETVATDSDGYYELEVPYNWTGTITAEKDGCVFVPTPRIYSTGVKTQKSSQNFSGYLTVSGYVRASGVTALPFVAITATNGGGTTTTNSAGFYTLVVPYNWTGKITPAMSGYTFVNSSISYAAITSSQSDENYTAYVKPTISGYIKTAGNAALSGVTVTATNSGGTATTNSSGYYVLTVPYNWSGTITPTKSNCSFATSSKSYTNVTSVKSAQNYTVYINPTISGYIKTVGKMAISGVKITANNSGGTTTTNSSGYYALTVPYNWKGTITPTKTGRTFTQSSKTYSTSVTTSKSSQNFTGK